MPGDPDLTHQGVGNSGMFPNQIQDQTSKIAGPTSDKDTSHIEENERSCTIIGN